MFIEEAVESGVARDQRALKGGDRFREMSASDLIPTDPEGGAECFDIRAVVANAADDGGLIGESVFTRIGERIESLVL